MYNNITTFIHNLFGTDEFVPLHAPLFIGNEKKYLAECIDTTFVSSVGKFVDRFEEQVASYTGSKRAVVCVSGTNALHMGMLLVGVERDDEVLLRLLLLSLPVTPSVILAHILYFLMWIEILWVFLLLL